MFALGDQDLRSARIALPTYGVWSARVVLLRSKVLAVGSATQITVGDLILQGVIRAGGDFQGRSSYLVVGGAGGWDKLVGKRPHRADNGVRLSTVVGDVAAEVGEQVVLETGVERSVGYAWLRAAGVAASIFEPLGVRWWVAPDGVTHVGDRPSTRVPASLRLLVEDYDPAIPMATLVSPDDAYAALQPGAIVAGPEGDFTIADVDLYVEAGQVRVDLWGGTALEDSLRQIAQLMGSRSAYQPLHEYLVQEQIGARLTVRPVGSAPELPDGLLLDKAHGIAGASEVSSPGSVVLVGFRDGDPGRPYIAGFLGSTPLSVGLDAATEIRLGGVGAVALATAPGVNAALDQFSSAIVALGGPPVVWGNLNTTKVAGE